MIYILPPVIFIIFLIIAWILGTSSIRLAPKGPMDENADTAYAGGEDFPASMKFPGYERFFAIALFFTVLHVLALILGLMIKGEMITGLLFTGIISIALIAILTDK